MRNSLIYSRKTGVLTAVGVAFWDLGSFGLSLLGLGIVISKTVWLLHLFKYLGAGYLIYIGIKGIMTRKRAVDYGEIRHKRDISSFAALRTGFLTNALNAKCMLFFLSILFPLF